MARSIRRSSNAISGTPDCAQPIVSASCVRHTYMMARLSSICPPFGGLFELMGFATPRCTPCFASLRTPFAWDCWQPPASSGLIVDATGGHVCPGCISPLAGSGHDASRLCRPPFGGLGLIVEIPPTPHYAHCVRSYGATFFRSPVPCELLLQTDSSMAFVYALCSMTTARRV